MVFQTNEWISINDSCFDPFHCKVATLNSSYNKVSKTLRTLSSLFPISLINENVYFTDKNLIEYPEFNQLISGSIKDCALKLDVEDELLVIRNLTHVALSLKLKRKGAIFSSKMGRGLYYFKESKLYVLTASRPKGHFEAIRGFKPIIDKDETNRKLRIHFVPKQLFDVSIEPESWNEWLGQTVHILNAKENGFRTIRTATLLEVDSKMGLATVQRGDLKFSINLKAIQIQLDYESLRSIGLFNDFTRFLRFQYDDGKNMIHCMLDFFNRISEEDILRIEFDGKGSTAIDFKRVDFGGD